MTDSIAAAASKDNSAGPWRPHRVYAVLGSVFGLVFALCFPPGMVPDESKHFLRSYLVSEGYLHPGDSEQGGGSRLPRSTIALAHHLDAVRFHPDRKIAARDLEHLWTLNLDPQDSAPASSESLPLYPPLPYLPQALGIALARLVGLRPAVLFYAGRLANLLCATLLIWLAIRCTPVFKLGFCMLALLPITIQQVSSLSADALTIALSFLTIAVILRLVVRSSTVSFRDLLLLLGLSALLASTKPPYGLLALFALAIPRRCFGSTIRYACAGLGLLVLVGVLTLAVITYANHYGASASAVDPGPGWPVDAPGQLHHVETHPLSFLLACWNTTVRCRFWIDDFGVLGYLDTQTPPVLVRTLLLIVLAVVVADQRPNVRLSVWLKALGLSLAGLCAGFIFLALYLNWSPPASPLVAGIQARYFLPILPLLLLAVSQGPVRFHFPQELLLMLAGAGSAILLAVATAAFLQRYYYTDTPLYLSPLAVIVVALGLIGVVVLIRKRLRLDPLPPFAPRG